MENQWDEIYENEVINATPARNLEFGSWLPRRFADGRYLDAMLEAMEDRYDALMAKNILEHAGAFSMMEAKIGQALPRTGTGSKQSWTCTPQRLYGGLEGGKTMIFIVMPILTACAIGLIILVALCLSAEDRKYRLEEENRRLRLLLKKSFMEEHDYREVCDAMLQEAGYSGGFQEDSGWENSEKN